MEDWDRIISEHTPAAWRTALRLLANEADASDCLQEAFEAAVKVSRSQDVANWQALLQRLVTVRCLRLFRQRMREKGRVRLDDCPDIPSRENDPSQHMQAQELGQQLRQGLALLPVEQATALCLRFLNELSYEDIAASMDVSVSKAGVLIHRGRSKLKSLLTDAENSQTGGGAP